MRYTTIIDIRHMQMYRNVNARLLYLHMVLASGYHDGDRDMMDCSIRKLAYDLGLTLSAVRHAIKQLETAGLLKREGQLWHITKWVIPEEITPRPKTKKQQREKEIAKERDSEQAMSEAQRERAAAAIEEMHKRGKTPFMVYYEQKLEMAKAGDAEALAAVERYRKTYEQHQQNMKKSERKEIK